MEQRMRTANDGSIEMTLESIQQFLDNLVERGCAPDTIATYRRSLMKLYSFLPPEKKVYSDTLEFWRFELLEKYTVRTANACVSAVNGYLEYHGVRSLQITKPLPLPKDMGPELTRAEYLHMLEEAICEGNERAYLLTKVFACTGITVRELQYLTVETVRAGVADVPSCGGTRVKIPECLRLELEDYASSQGVQTGPVFVTRNGQNMSRTSVTDHIQRLATAAHIDPGKGNPRCLRKLYLITREQIRLSLMPLAEQAHEQMIDTEQFSVGWKKRKGS